MTKNPEVRIVKHSVFDNEVHWLITVEGEDDLAFTVITPNVFIKGESLGQILFASTNPLFEEYGGKKEL